MLRGRFGDTTGRPYLERRLLIPRLNVNSDISFLVDTGSDVTVLNPGDSIRVALNFSQLKETTETSGIGGSQNVYLEPAILAFIEPDRRLIGYTIPLHISPAATDVRLASLLGRNVLDRWRMVYDPGKGKLTFTVKSADIAIPL